MKSLSILLFAFFFGVRVYGQQQARQLSYPYNGGRIVLTEDQDHILVKLSKQQNSALAKAQLASNTAFTVDEKRAAGEIMIMESAKSGTQEQRQTSLGAIKGMTGIESANYMVRYNGLLAGYTNEFIVRVAQGVSPEDFQNFMKKNLVTVVRQNEFNDRQFVLAISKNSRYSLFDMVDRFHESKLVEYAEPNMLVPNALQDVPNDPLWSQQWNLNNTGQIGGTTYADINLLNAWTITSGREETIVAVIDSGVDLDHPDLSANILPGYDAIGLDNDANPNLSFNGSHHGTAVAGVIAAVRDNGIGLSGVAPLAKILPIRAIDFNSTTDQMFNAIEWAWFHGADVINNSWTWTPSSSIDNAIADAIGYGRSGLGTVVVFAVGNDNHYGISYPATLPNVIAVGATNQCEQRKRYNSCDGETDWGSNWGEELDVMAPGVFITTTDIAGTDGLNHDSSPNGDYLGDWHATSSAAPHVSGVAALVLSVNPCITDDEVRRIINLSATKVGAFCYARDASHPDGLWNGEMGYGRVDAYKAVRFANTIGGGSGTGLTGTDIGTTSISSFNPLPCFGPSGSFSAVRHEIVRNITFPQTIAPSIVATSNGFFDQGSNRQPVIVSNVTETSATLTTYVYNMVAFPAVWVPVAPADVRFDYVVNSEFSGSRRFTNQIVSTSLNYWSAHEITAGYLIPNIGPGIVASGGNVNFRAKDYIVLQAGFSVSAGASFTAKVGPFFTCIAFPNGRVGAGNTVEDFTLPVIESFELNERSVEKSFDPIESFTATPNPFKDNFTLNYALKEEGSVRIELLDTKGTLITAFDSNHPFPASSYELKINASNLASGVYIVTLKTITGIKTLKLIKE